MTSHVEEFYRGKNLFITGGTGFLGIAIIEKLLRSCPDIAGIYLLMRPKKGKEIQDRLDELTKNKVSDLRRPNSKSPFQLQCNVSQFPDL